MEIHIPQELIPEIEKIVQTLKFSNKEEFINSAIRDKILD
jgi:metal-responsive CopG/Arc/MetJ family transcriptional regulator